MKFDFFKKDFVEQQSEPDKTAIIGNDFELSWVQFEIRVNDLCAEFKEHSLYELKYPVIIYGHKSANMIVAIYAMMKLKIPYIPIDIIYPIERLAKVKKISGSQVLINTTQSSLEIDFDYQVRMNKNEILIDKGSCDIVKEDVGEDPLVYIIFTSGSTGEPKGVQISSEAVQSFVGWMKTAFGFNSHDVFINTAILSFDLSVFELMTFGELGATMLLNSNSINSDPHSLLPRIKKYSGSIWISTPSFALIYSRIGNDQQMDSVTSFLFCGEVLPNGLAKDLLKNFPKARVINTYGPTEATVATTIVDITEEIVSMYDPLPVGRVKENTQLLIQNNEITIVGQNISIGYLNNPELNRQKFSIIDGKRAFKTGDGGYFDGDMLFFQGRKDDLVKLHGYRIELNEITTAILNLNYVYHAETIALKRNDIAKKIVSLVHLKTDVGHVDVETIKAELAKTLPIYMVPADIKFVDAIPLNQNGKVDKNRLTELYLKG